MSKRELRLSTDWGAAPRPTRTFGRHVAYEHDMENWEFECRYDSRTPASRMSLAACRCFYRVLAAPKGAFVRVEPVLQPKLSDQDASGVVGAWVWDVPVEREGECHT